MKRRDTCRRRPHRLGSSAARPPATVQTACPPPPAASHPAERRRLSCGALHAPRLVPVCLNGWARVLSASTQIRTMGFCRVDMYKSCDMSVTYMHMLLRAASNRQHLQVVHGDVGGAGLDGTLQRVPPLRPRQPRQPCGPAARRQVSAGKQGSHAARLGVRSTAEWRDSAHA